MHEGVRRSGLTAIDLIVAATFSILFKPSPIILEEGAIPIVLWVMTARAHLLLPKGEKVQCQGLFGQGRGLFHMHAPTAF